jgi:hypothetical protein
VLAGICIRSAPKLKTGSRGSRVTHTSTDVSERGRHVTSDFVRVFGAECGRGMSAAYVPQNRINLPPPATIYEFTVMSRGDLVAHPFADELSLRRQFSTVIAGKGKLKCWDIWQSQ